ncbi:MAG: alpha/beta hydrolase [Bacteroidales bacterium]|nr:alpha/beta hydrolase [Bacteroidales bacterium]
MRKLSFLLSLSLMLIFPFILPAQNSDEGTPLLPDCREKEVTIETAQGVLTGTLTLPLSGEKNFPAMLLISGSGAQDRDCTIGGYKPFKVLAGALAQKGYASLRLDDRGVGGSAAPKGYYGYKESVADAEAALKWLETCPEINAHKTGVLGHSMGGAIAFSLAEEFPDEVRCVVALAAPAVTGKEMMIRQNELISNAVGKMLSTEMHEAFEEIFSAVEKGDGSLISEAVTKYGPGAGMDPQTYQAQIRVLSSPEYVEMVQRDYSAPLKNVKCPVLALIGEWDVQVDPKANLLSIKLNIPSAQVATVATTNHLFQTATDSFSSLNYGAPGAKFSVEALRMIASFLESNL